MKVQSYQKDMGTKLNENDKENPFYYSLESMTNEDINECKKSNDKIPEISDQRFQTWFLNGVISKQMFIDVK